MRARAISAASALSLAALAASLTACSSLPANVPAAGPQTGSSSALGAANASSDAASRRLYVADAGNGGMLAFRLRASGDARPVRTIRGSKTGSSSAFDIAFDSKERVYLSDCCNGIFVYGSNAEGNAKPIRHIVGAASDLLVPFALAVDAADELYVGNFTDIRVYAPGADGAAKPIRKITGPATMVNQVEGISLDDEGHIFAIDRLTNSVLEFAANADGNATPIAVISGSNTLMSFPIFVSVSTKGEIYVTDEGPIEVYAKGSNGNVAPVRVIEPGDSTAPQSRVAVVGNDMYVGVEDLTQNDAFGVYVYDARDNGISAPIRTIVGPHTQIGQPYDVVIR